jgi:beta-N-acetylhexosaminidase
LTATDFDRLAGRVIVAGFDGHELPDDVRAELAAGALGGIVLFGRNVASHLQVAALIEAARAAAPAEAPPVVAVDQEGGRVVRLREPLTVLPPARTLGRIDRPDLTEEAGRLVGAELRALGFTLDLAPVLDVDTNPASPVIGDRSFGPDPDLVVGHGLAFARGLRAGGVFPCGKHFPGHGDATLDSHRALPRVEHDLERLERVELEPFRAWAWAGLGPLMTAHVVFPALDPDRPATCSPRILRDLLRGRLRFRGVVLSDDLEMGAVNEVGGAPAVALAAIGAGADGLLVCRDAAARGAVRTALARAARSDPATAGRLEKVGAALASLGRAPGPFRPADWIGSDGHRRLQERVLGALARGAAAP